MSTTFPARYAGQCRACGEEFDAGDQIGYRTKHDVYPSHAECEPCLTLGGLVICEVCWCSKPCLCD